MKTRIFWDADFETYACRHTDGEIEPLRDDGEAHYMADRHGVEFESAELRMCNECRRLSDEGAKDFQSVSDGIMVCADCREAAK